MYGDHVLNDLPVYVNGGLTREVSREIEDHLIVCAICRLEFEQLKLESAYTSKLPSFPGGRRLTSKRRLQAVDSEHARKEREEDIRDLLRPLENRRVTVAIILGVIFSAAALYFLNRPDGAPSISVRSTQGAPLVGLTRIRGLADMNAGEWLETDTRSQASIDVGHRLQLEIGPATRVSLLDLRDGMCRLALQRGTLRSNAMGPPRHVSIDTPSGVLIDLGSEYTVSIDDAGAGVLQVASGWMELDVGGRSVLIPQNASCKMNPSVGPGTPYFDDESQAFKTALSAVDFGSMSAPGTDKLERLLSLANKHDALTLWNLFPRVNDQQRQALAAHLNEIAPIPSGVDLQAAIHLNPESLRLWFAEIISQEGLSGPPGSSAPTR